MLSDDELRWFWLACDEIGWPFGPLAKLLLLTAQRRDEVAGMTWAEIDLDKTIWTIPGEKAKNDRDHEVQLSDGAIEVLRSIPRVGDDLVFTTTGDDAGVRLLASEAPARRCDARRQARRVGRERRAIPDWTLHDLRRTAATGMARLNFPPHVVDKVLNHVERHDPRRGGRLQPV